MVRGQEPGCKQRLWDVAAGAVPPGTTSPSYQWGQSPGGDANLRTQPGSLALKPREQPHRESQGWGRPQNETLSILTQGVPVPSPQESLLTATFLPAPHRAHGQTHDPGTVSREASPADQLPRKDTSSCTGVSVLRVDSQGPPGPWEKPAAWKRKMKTNAPRKKTSQRKQSKLSEKYSKNIPMNVCRDI